jgi:hypothetical protein
MSLVKYNNNSISAVTSASSIPSGAMTLIKTITASSDSTISFVHGSSDVVLDSTYPIYVFKFINIHPSSESGSPAFSVNFSSDSGSNYNVTKTTTCFAAYHAEDDSAAAIGYRTSDDIAQGTGFQILNTDSGAGNDESTSGEMFLFNPSSTTFVKHFMTNTNFYQVNDLSMNFYTAGYCNTTSAVDAVQFKFTIASGVNIDSGTIKLYGIKDS